MKKKETKGQKFIEKRMHTFKEGGMHSSTKKGPVVHDPKQAIAISLSEARKKHMKVSPAKKGKK